MAIGQNLDAVTYHSTAPVFVNGMKMARSWLTRSAGGSEWDSGYGDGGANLIPKRADGYPLYVPFTVSGTPQWVHTIIPVYENGSHRLMAQGTGTVQISGPGLTQTFTFSGALDVSVNFSGANSLAAWDSSGLPQRREPSRLLLVIQQSSAADPVRDIRVMRPGFHNAGPHDFDPSLIDALNPYTTIRFMDWQRTNNQTNSSWSHPANNVNHYTQASSAGVAIEHCVALANQTGKNAWLCVPERYDDTSIQQMANYVASALGAGRRLYIEYGNEHWNTLFSIRTQWLPSAPYAGSNLHQKYGTRAKYIFDTFRAAFAAAGKSAQLVCVLSGQAANSNVITQALVTAGSSTDAIAIAPYFGTNFSSAPATIPTMDELASETYARLGTTRNWISTHRTVAQGWGIPLVYYEGGQHYTGINGQENNNALITRLLEFNRDWRMRNLYRYNYLSDLASGGAALFNNFALAGRWSKWGAWGNIEYWGQPVGTRSGMAQREWAVRDWLANQAPPPAEVVFETGHPPAAQSSDVHRVFNESTASGGTCAILEANATGDFVTYAVPGVGPGTYRVMVRLKRANNRGQFQVAASPSLGGPTTSIGGTQEGYASSQQYVEVDAGPLTWSTSGTAYLRFTIVGKNASSSGYWIAIDRIRLTPAL